MALKGARKETYHVNRTKTSVTMIDPIVSNEFPHFRCIKISDSLSAEEL